MKQFDMETVFPDGPGRSVAFGDGTPSTSQQGSLPGTEAENVAILPSRDSFI
jgi:hypothetical protein